MLSSKFLVNAILKRSQIQFIQSAAHSTGGFHDERFPIGKREWVCYGVVSQPHYCDRPDYPIPAVRFREITEDLIPLKEKEKGDWKKLTIEEKKKLYRASFCQTLAEVMAPTGHWKSVVGWSFLLVGLGLWLYFLEKIFVYQPKPFTFSEENRAKIFRIMLVNKTGHLTGVSSKWDYEKDDWKK